MNPTVNLHSQRARDARLRKRLQGFGSGFALAAVAACVMGALYSIAADNWHFNRLAYVLLAVAILVLMLFAWVRRFLLPLKSSPNPTKLDDVLSPSLLANIQENETPRHLWQLCQHEWEAKFICNRLVIPMDNFDNFISDNPADMAQIWATAEQLRASHNSNEMHSGTVATALMMHTEAVTNYLRQRKLPPDSLLATYDWLQRLVESLKEPKLYFGGIGRDWAVGYTPTLEQYGHNISAGVQAQGGIYRTLAHSDITQMAVHSLSQGNGSIALVGEVGSGKTALVESLAQRLIEGKESSLMYQQIVSLNASQILSQKKEQLEQIILTLFGEAVRAKNIILFFDDAPMFFSSGTGAFDMSQILMPLMDNNRLKIIAAFTPSEFQRLKAANSPLAAKFTVVNVPEPPEDVVYSILQDAALGIEHRDTVMITYEAIREAYKLSGQFINDSSYPGKAIGLLSSSSSFASNGIVTAASVQGALEKSLGVKVSAADAPEADRLLNLENLIHERMINQTRAVKVVSAALRRGRAGVSSSKRPIGSFLFLGPTGVGKTELARSLAAVYYQSESNIIRLDMSEFQNATDVERILSDGGTQTGKSLLMSIREQPFSVVLLDEFEKAHPNVHNLLLQLLDEGQLTDVNGRPASFRNAIIIVTSNAGAREIIAQTSSGGQLDDFERPLIDKLIADGLFKPELINRFDEVVLFRQLNQEELGQVARLMIGEVNQQLAQQNVSVTLTDAAYAEITRLGFDPQFGARPMRRTIQRSVEDVVANRILAGAAQPGTVITLDVGDLTQQS